MDDSHSSTKQPPFPFMDSDHKSTKFHPFSFSPSPHMQAFHLAWLSLFSCFFSTFSIPPLIPVIRNDLNLTPTHISNAGIASFLGSIFSRLAMGPTCDLLGPRIASAAFSLVTVPVILSMCLVTTPTSFIIIRFLVGFCLANFVANQYWMASMFSPCVVGAATSFSAGWAAMGSGFSQLVMPEIYSLICSTNISSNSAWRAAFLVPAIFQAITAILVMVYGQDHPTGQNGKDCKKADKKPEESFLAVLFNGLTNYRGWVLGLAYGYSFGSELTTNNVIAQYFYDRFGVNLQVAGVIAASFGLANGFSRPIGGLLSDKLGRRFGVRGWLWGLWVVQTLAGLLSVLLGRVNSLWSSIAVMCIFSVFVQAASGLTFGVVPFVSKRSLGVISGMTGSGGTVGAVVTQPLLFSGSRCSKQISISLMGVVMVICTLPVTSIYFPQWGGMFCSSSSMEDAEEDYHLACSINSSVPKHR